MISNGGSRQRAQRRLIDDLSPKLKIASSNLVEASHTIRHQANHVNATVEDVLDKTTVQAARVNEMLGSSRGEQKQYGQFKESTTRD